MLEKLFDLTKEVSKFYIMYLLSIKFKAAFGKEEKIVEISQPSGGGGSTYVIMIDNYYKGIIANQLGGWRVVFQKPNHEYNMGDLQPLIDLVKGEY